MNILTSQEILDLARGTLHAEAEALNNMAALLNEEFVGAVNNILYCRVGYADGIGLDKLCGRRPLGGRYTDI